MPRLLSALVGLALLAPVQVAVPTAVSGAQSAMTMCRNGFYLVQGRQLLRFDDRGRRYLPVARLPEQTNAIAYARQQGRFYAIAGSRAVTITPDGRLSHAGPVPQGLRGAAVATARGQHWIIKTSHAVVTLRIPDLAVIATVPLSRAMPVHDWDLNPADGMLYGLSSGLFPRLLRANPETGRVSVVTTPRGLPVGGGFGAVAIDPHGVLHALHNISGTMYHLPLSSPQRASASDTGLRAARSDAATCPVVWDYGDFSGEVARHLVTTLAVLSLGTVVGSDDGLSPETAVPSSATSYDLTVAVHNTTGRPALLAGWHDLDNDGRFATDESATATVPPGATSAVLRWAQVNVDPGIREARFRLRIYGEAPAHPAPAGSASGGEVEDHLLPVTRPPSRAPSAAPPAPAPSASPAPAPSVSPMPTPPPTTPAPTATPARHAAPRPPKSPPGRSLPITLSVFAGLLVPVITVATRAIARKGRVR